MHIPHYFRRNLEILLFSQNVPFSQNLRSFASPCFEHNAFMHHALRILDAQGQPHQHDGQPNAELDPAGPGPQSIALINLLSALLAIVAAVGADSGRRLHRFILPTRLGKHIKLMLLLSS